MGVQGLTSYVNENADHLLRDFKLKNTLLIIDGYALAATLYINSKKLNSAFSGDYDKYAKVVSNFFELLSKCEVSPVVVCDGGYEPRKVNTIKSRTRAKIFSMERVTPLSSNLQCFPLLMRHVFREVVLSLGVCLLVSDFEADPEIAALGKLLSAPVLSNDSDFFIFDVLFIPLSTLDLFSSRKDKETGCSYLECKLFGGMSYRAADSQLMLGGLPRSMLPLLATLLGNDYIKSSVAFSPLYTARRINCDGGRQTARYSKRVRGILSYLRGETVDSALAKILCNLKRETRGKTKRHIEKIMRGYTDLETPLVAYLPPQLLAGRYLLPGGDKDRPDEEDVCYQGDTCRTEKEDECKEVYVCYSKDKCQTEEDVEPEKENVCDPEDKCLTEEEGDANGKDKCQEVEEGSNVEDECYIEDECQLEEEESDEEDVCDPEDECDIEDECQIEEDDIESDEFPNSGKRLAKIPDFLLEESRKGNLSSCLVSCLSLKAWFADALVEDFRRPHAGQIGLPILRRLLGHLGLPSISYWARHNRQYVSTVLAAIPQSKVLTSQSALKQMTHSEKEDIILEAFEVKNKHILNNFPKKWQLYIIPMIYWIQNKKDDVKPCHIHALIISLITVNVINSKIGPFWQRKNFTSKWGEKLKGLSSKRSVEGGADLRSIDDIIAAVEEVDCALGLDSVLDYYSIDSKLHRRSQLFSRESVHLFNEFQILYDLVVAYNSLLGMVYPRSHLGLFFNGTFIYNFTMNFKNRSNIMSYLENLFSKTPLFIILYKKILENIDNLVLDLPKQKLKKRKPKVKKEVKILEPSTLDLEQIQEFYDVNNKFSVLTIA